MTELRGLRLVPLGDRGLLVELGEVLTPQINARARVLAGGLRDVAGVEEAIPTLRSVLILYDPLHSDLGALAETVEHLAATRGGDLAGGGREVEVPALYGGSAGPDLEEVAGLHGLTPQQAVRLHSEVQYTVYMLGFTPGFPYLGIVADALRTPRLPSPRLQVPEGSIGIADAMTGVYPLASAGGWRLLGRTPLRIYDPLAQDPVLLRPGDRVRFTPVARADFPDRPPARLPIPDRPVIEVGSPGLYTTIQDGGRRGARALGIPPSGAMDPLALWAANTAAGNAQDAPALELTAPGPVLKVLDHVTIAISGADLSPAIDGSPLAPHTPAAVRPGQTVAFGAPRAGVWAYLAVGGGFDARHVLGSASTFVPGMLGGSAGRRLREGDLLGVTGAGARRPRALPIEIAPLPKEEVTVRVIPGPHDEWLTEEARRALLKEVYRPSLRSDRSGMRLEGRPLAHRKTGEFLSDGVLPGAIQIPAGGQPIIIMPDGPTTGGYPQAAVVISADLRLVAQARSGTRLRFRPVAMEEALHALRRQRERCAELLEHG